MISIKEQAKNELKKLIEDYQQIIRNGKLPEFSESDVSSKFILPLLKIFGWDTRNIDEVKEQKRTLTGPVDYSLSLSRRPKIFLELKKFVESLDGRRVIRGKEETYAEQAIRYAWHLKVDWVVLTNFDETRLYYSHVIKPQDGLIFRFRHDQYLENFDRIWILAKESVSSGVLDSYEKRRTRKNIDKEVLEDLIFCRRLLTANIRTNHPDLTIEDVRESIQKILDRILVIRVAEDRNIIGSDSMWKEQESWRARGLPTPLIRSLKSLFRDFDDIYNTKLFEPHLCEDLGINNQTIEEVIERLYRYNFDLISADVLGAIYEDYIGHILEETTSGGVQITENHDTRKKEGIYYTPTYLVEFVVRETLGELLKNCKSPDEVSAIKVLDPACGSGSFLIKAFDIIKEWYEDYNRKIYSKGNSLEHHFQAVTDVEQRILRDNLFGVDIDSQAAEIASVNLILKAIKRGQKLPQILDQNIKIGNSLVDGTETGYGTLTEQERVGLKPLKWQVEFPQVFANGGFDVVIGNPPYFKVRKTNSIRTSLDFDAVKSGPVNAAMMFVNRSISLANPGGRIGLVLPKMLTYTKGWQGSRRKVFTTKIRSIIDCQEAFESVLLEQVLLTLEKNNATEPHTYRVGKAKELIVTTSHSIPQKLSEQENFIFLEPTKIAYSIREKMLDKTVQLGKICNIVLGKGIQSYGCWHDKPQPGDLRILRGDDVQMWHIRDSLYFSKDAPEMTPFKNEILDLSIPHIVTQRIVAHIKYPKPHIILMAAYDKKGSFVFNTVVHFVVTDSYYDYRYILALLNSKLFSYYAYKFIYNNAIRSMDFYEDYAERLLVKQLALKEQKPLIDIVDSIITHFKQPNRQKPEYQNYITEKIVGYQEFNDYYRQLNPSERDPKDTTTVGIIQNLHVTEEDDWLIFKIDYLDQKLNKQVTGHEVLRCRFSDRRTRTFLLKEIIKGASKQGKRFLDKILVIRLPRFGKTRDQNESLIHKQLEPYLTDYDAYQMWQKQYAILDEKLNQKIYEIYGLSTEELRHVEENSRPTGWHSDTLSLRSF